MRPISTAVIVTRAEADRIAEGTADAYSWDRYGPDRWRACCRLLARKGFSGPKIEAIMRSKWTRWAGDASGNPYGRVNSADLWRFVRGEGSPQGVRELVQGTFGGSVQE